MTIYELKRWLQEKVAEKLQLSIAEVSFQEPFSSMGLSSVQAVELAGELEELLGREFDDMLLYEYPDIDSLSEHLCKAA
jgi:phthiocerol/phenolphthiocerol synthesis type-I polyketide synthase D